MRAEFYHNEGMRPLVITAWLAERLAARMDELPMIDGLFALARCWTLPENKRPPQVTRRDEHASDMPIRLAKWRVPFDGDAPDDLRDRSGMVWGYVATSPQPVGDVLQSAEAVRCMTDTRAMGHLTTARKVSIGTGPTKARDMRASTVQCAAIRWWLIGHRKEIRRRYLRLDSGGRGAFRYIGGRRGIGFGRVLRWEVETADVTPEWILERRWMPAGYRDGRIAMRGVRAPYWHRSRQMLCVEPAA
jgi:hypothetical protein